MENYRKQPATGKRRGFPNARLIFPISSIATLKAGFSADFEASLKRVSFLTITGFAVDQSKALNRCVEGIETKQLVPHPSIFTKSMCAHKRFETELPRVYLCIRYSNLLAQKKQR
jgi:hypothetical protein